MIPFEVTEEQLAQAIKEGKRLGKLPNSIEGGKKNDIGFIGKNAVATYLGGTASNKGYYDINVGNKVIQVRSKTTTAYPLPHYEVSVADTPNVRTMPYDYYVFTRIMDDKESGWILGYIGKNQFFKDAKFMRVGDVDPSNGYRVKQDCWNLPISALYPVQELKAKLYVVEQT
jgi:hypothetical protein